MNLDEWYLAGHTGLIAAKLKRADSRIEVENWRPDITVDRHFARYVEGILCRVFPARRIPFWGDWSPVLIKELIRFSKRPGRTIIHFGGISSAEFLFLPSVLGKRLRIVGNHQGDRPRHLRKGATNRSLRALEKRSFKKTHHFLCAGRTIMSCLREMGVEREAMSFPEIGVDLDVFKPMDQGEARSKLGLPAVKPLILHVGAAIPSKGLDRLLDFLPQISRHKGTELICVGCSEADQLFPRLKEMNIRWWPYVPQEMLVLFHNACDLLVRPVGMEKGPISVGVNVAEALACGTPVVSESLIEDPRFSDYGGQIGAVPGKDLAESVINQLHTNKENRSKVCRDAARVYSWDTWISQLIHVYSH